MKPTENGKGADVPQVARTAGENGERLQLLLARAGIASRRKAADLIRAGRVRINGVVAREPGLRVDPARETITFNGEPLPAPDRLRTIMMNKPVGVICSASDRQGRTVCDLIAHLPERLRPVGRLDRESTGLLLLSNDGNLIARLTHARYGHRKTYLVEVTGRCNAAVLTRLRQPMVIDDYRIQPVEVQLIRKQGGHTRLEFILREGRNRQIRKMCEAVGLTVVSLTRVAIDDLQLPESLAPGQWRNLTPAEVQQLLQGPQQAEHPQDAP